MKKFISVFIAILIVLSLTLSACGQPTPTEQPTDAPPTRPPYNAAEFPVEIESEQKEGYTFKKLYILNEEENRRLYAVEYIPDCVKDGEKVPFLVMQHGAGTATEDFEDLAHLIAKEGVGIFMVEVGNMTLRETKSDQSEDANPDISERVSDFMTGIEYYKTLDYVDRDRTYILARSMGGPLAMLASGYFTKDDFKGIIIESSGLGAAWTSMLDTTDEDEHVVEKYRFTAENWEAHVQKYDGDMLFICAQNDTTAAFGPAQYAYGVYSKRANGGKTDCIWFYDQSSGHTWDRFNDADKEIALNAIFEFMNVR